MNITTKELRDNPGKTLARVAGGQKITVTFRGKAVAEIIPIAEEDDPLPRSEDVLFGLWKDLEICDVDNHVRSLRKGRMF